MEVEIWKREVKEGQENGRKREKEDAVEAQEKEEEVRAMWQRDGDKEGGMYDRWGDGDIKEEEET